MEVFYSRGHRFIDGIDIDSDVDASHPSVDIEISVSDPVTGFMGRGYLPGQKNLDGSDL